MAPKSCRPETGQDSRKPRVQGCFQLLMLMVSLLLLYSHYSYHDDDYYYYDDC